MIKWAFVWSSKRPPIWENCTDAMNLAIGEKWAINDIYVPVNAARYPVPQTEGDPRLKLLKAPIIEQFESESFKYVIQTNNAGMNADSQKSPGQLILKEHLALDVTLTPDNSRAIDLDEVYSYLKKYSWVALGIPLSNIAISKQTLMAKSYYYTRDENFKVINLSGDNDPLEDIYSIATVTYCIFKKTANDELVMCILNPHLVSMPNLESRIYDSRHHVVTLDSYDSTIEDYFLAPRIEGSGIHTINKNVIFASTQFTIHDYENGIHFIRHGSKIKFDRIVKSNLLIKAKDDKIVVDPTRHFGYVSIEYNVDGMINRYGRASTSGKHKIDFIVAKG